MRGAPGLCKARLQCACSDVDVAGVCCCCYVASCSRYSRTDGCCAACCGNLGQ